jgi:hypothetical protein
MNLDSLLLKKEELPISEVLNFHVPIHPSLLNPDFYFDPRLANRLFEQALLEWYTDITAKLTAGKPFRGEWIKNHLKYKPKIKVNAGRQIIEELFWEDDVGIGENGFARAFTISRNHGGTLYFNKEEYDCEYPLFSESKVIRFSQEKINSYSFNKYPKNPRTYVYSKHNIDDFPGALFLRNWAIIYLNEALKQVNKIND